MIKKKLLEVIINLCKKIYILVDNSYLLNLSKSFSRSKNLLNDLFLKNFSTLPAGFEPAAHCLEGSCSIQLS